MDETRIEKLRLYLINIIDSLQENTDYQINANMLSNKVDDYSLDKIPTNLEESKWIIGIPRHKEIYSFRSRKSYAQDTITNLKNMGFFEKVENTIETSKYKGILPDINGIEEIKCLSPFTMIKNDDGKTAIFDIQIQITYRANIVKKEQSNL